MKKKWLSGVLLAASAVLAGCAGGAYIGYGPPPPPRLGMVGVAPSPGYIWTDGFWDLRGGRWVWVGGRWLRPPRRNAVWVRSEWRQEGGRWRYHRGYWRR